MKKKNRVPAILGIAILLALVGIWTVNSANMEQEMTTSYQKVTIQDIPSKKWDHLATKTIYFGHMSVGLNIIDGIRDILSENPNMLLDITELKETSQVPPNGFCHAPLGHNMEPLLKIHSFKSQIMGLKNAPDIAFLKFCYVDFYAKTDVYEIFDAYQATMAELQEKFPDTVFMHCTVPLTTGPQTPKRKVKELVKKCLSRPVTIDDNQKRTEFSDLLKKNYPPETIVDLAQFESTTPEGIRFFKTKNGEKVPFLREAFTSDGGHLNETGRKRVAEQLLIHLANYQ